MNYTTFPSEAKYNICLLCVDYLQWAVFDIITLKTRKKSAKLSESTETIALVLLNFIKKIGFV